MIKRYLSRIRPAGFLKRVLAVLFIVAACAFGISCYYAAGLGADTISVFVSGISAVTGLSLGTVTNICNLILTALMLFFGRRYLGPGTILSLLLTGFLIDFFVPMLTRAFPPDTAPLWIRIGILLTGLLMCGVFIGLFVFADFGVGPFDFVTLTARDLLKTVELRWVRVGADFLYLTIGWLLGGTVGVGTILAALLTGPLMALSMKHLGPLFTRLCGQPYRNEDPAGTSGSGTR